MLLKENFLLYNSGSLFHEELSSEDEAEEPEHAEATHRVLVFATRRNIEFLCGSTTWFVDGTFSTSPNLFLQIFTILGIQTQAGRPEDVIAILYIYAPLTSKSTNA